jgi:hypothetical protein
MKPHEAAKAFRNRPVQEGQEVFIAGRPSVAVCIPFRPIGRTPGMQRRFVAAVDHFE